KECARCRTEIRPHHPGGRFSPRLRARFRARSRRRNPRSGNFPGNPSSRRSFADPSDGCEPVRRRAAARDGIPGAFGGAAGDRHRQGLIIDSDGLRRNREIIAAAAESEIYAALGMDFVEPELREGRGEVALALARSLPALVTDRDLRGILHAHTDASDGVHGLEPMAEAVRERGYEYLGVADHSRSAGYAGGLSIDDVAAQHARIERWNAHERGRFRIFAGIESDILPDGSLDYPDEVLARFDFVVASVHSRFALDRATQTERILRAVANSYTTILGHMTGRQLLRRPGYDIDIERVLAACAKHGVAVEINANPWRLDLDWRWHERGLQLGCMFSINPDAHSTSEIERPKPTYPAWSRYSTRSTQSRRARPAMPSWGSSKRARRSWRTTKARPRWTPAFLRPPKRWNTTRSRAMARFGHGRRSSACRT